ncbi:PREDICTED: uncharacterized protein LOC105573033 [Cercocebus atys]|uniref:uncharacterized protein LOC105573033 n=1 Tax=Cercocebus atys TaxID=9531 RepID=UPI0005F40C92|nr:PREDICTED: uncharacterized protein LOC105573033 [Cercocebus atys]
MKGAGFGVGEPLSSYRTLAQAGLEREFSEKRRICLEVEVGLGLSGPDELPDPISWQLERSREKIGERKVSRELVRQAQSTGVLQQLWEGCGGVGAGAGVARFLEKRDWKGKGRKMEGGAAASQWIRLSALPGWELDTLPWQHGSDCAQDDVPGPLATSESSPTHNALQVPGPYSINHELSALCDSFREHPRLPPWVWSLFQELTGSSMESGGLWGCGVQPWYLRLAGTLCTCSQESSMDPRGHADGVRVDVADDAGCLPLHVRFRFCGDLDCPDWVLAEISTLAKMSSVKLWLLCSQVLKSCWDGGLRYENILKLKADAKFESGDMKATVVVLSFILCSAAKHSVNGGCLSSEVQQLGLPKKHMASLCHSYEEKQSPLQKHLGSATYASVVPGSTSGRRDSRDCRTLSCI